MDYDLVRHPTAFGSACISPELGRPQIEYDFLGTFNNFSPDVPPSRGLFMPNLNGIPKKNLNDGQNHLFVAPKDAVLKSAAASLFQPRPDPYSRTHVVDVAHSNFPLLSGANAVGAHTISLQNAAAVPNPPHQLFGPPNRDTLASQHSLFGSPQLEPLDAALSIGHAAPDPHSLDRAKQIVTNTGAVGIPYTPQHIPAPTISHAVKTTPAPTTMLPYGLVELAQTSPSFTSGPSQTLGPLSFLEAFSPGFQENPREGFRHTIEPNFAPIHRANPHIL